MNGLIQNHETLDVSSQARVVDQVAPPSVRDRPVEDYFKDRPETLVLPQAGNKPGFHTE